MPSGADRQLTRRRLLTAGTVAGGLLAAGACAATPPPPPAPPSAPPPATTSGQQADRPAGQPAVELVRSEAGRPEVALTFHGAGSPDLTRRLLELATQRGARLTVLAVGSWLQQYPEAARMVLDGGHELGNHTWSHPALAGLPTDEVRAEIVRCRDRLVDLSGSPGSFFRPSSAQHATPAQLRIAGSEGYARVLSYDIDSTDWTDPGPDAIRRAVAAADRGSVVSLHLGHPGTLAALPGVLDDLAARGLRPVSATEAFG